MRLLFCNIGWAEHYDGRANDAPRRGGSYNDDNIGHEVCNFLPYRGKVFGYVQVAHQGKINIGRLGANKGAESVDGITVVWTAGPDDGGTVVVGWYNNATVYSEAQALERPHGPRKIRSGAGSAARNQLEADCRDGQAG